ncbi:hypothetical protein ACIBH1_32510 [Nonomuraea sp. NPDC050663]|uniref:hypothetical protein n=1 Tax=Nonomuraea sp. NPDC050663 TaxID=3364370 RepID=UPI0037998D27
MKLKSKSALDGSVTHYALGGVTDIPQMSADQRGLRLVLPVAWQLSAHSHEDPDPDSRFPYLADLLLILSHVDTFIGVLDAAHFVRVRLYQLPFDDPRFSGYVRQLEQRSSRVSRVRRIAMNSPLVVDLLIAGISSAGVATAAAYIFKNPDKIGSWFPSLQTAWYNGRVEAEKAKQAYEELLRARAELRELEP